MGIEHIPAYSPQARGRSERANRTLQDRLVNELRLAGVTEVEAANRFIREIYLPEHNRLFAREPADPTNCCVSASGVQLEDILCIEEERTVTNDNIVRYENQFFQLPKQRDRATCKGLKVKLREHLDGTYSIVRGVKVLGRFDAEARLLTPPTITGRKVRKAA